MEIRCLQRSHNVPGEELWAVNGEFVVAARWLDRETVLSIFWVRRPLWISSLETRLEAVAREVGAFVRSETVIDGRLVVVRPDAVDSIVNGLARERLGDADYTLLTAVSAREALLRLIAGGSLGDRERESFEEAHLPFGYSFLDAVADLRRTGLVKLERHGEAEPRFTLTARGRKALQGGGPDQG